MMFKFKYFIDYFYLDTKNLFIKNDKAKLLQKVSFKSFYNTLKY